VEANAKASSAISRKLKRNDSSDQDKQEFDDDDDSIDII